MNYVKYKVLNSKGEIQILPISILIKIDQMFSFHLQHMILTNLSWDSMMIIKLCLDFLCIFFLVLVGALF